MITLDKADEKFAENVLLGQLRDKLAAIQFLEPASVAALIISPKHGEHVSMQRVDVVPEVGVTGDRPYKQWWRGKRMEGRQISAINAEVLDALGIGYQTPGDNLIIRGIDLAQFEEGDLLRVGDVLLRATGTPHRPCKLFARRTSTPHYVAISAGRFRGTMFDAVDPGTIRVRDDGERISANR